MVAQTKEIQKASISAAKRMLKSCRKLEPQIPRGKLSFTINSETYIHLKTKNDASLELGLLGKTKAQLDKKTKTLEKQLAKTLKWLTTGKKLFEEDFSHPAEFMPNVYFLLYMEREALPPVPSKEIYTSYFVLALYLITLYESSRLMAFGEDKDFEDPTKALHLTQKSASSLEFLLLAQTALEFGFASKRAAQFGLDRKNEERDFKVIFDLALRSKDSQDHLEQATHSRSKKAIDKWAPLLFEVKALLDNGRGVTNACLIVANRHPELEMEQLRKAYYKHRKTN
jgi:biopolymer transport protein ExbB/TolQ